jgi:hypothetical protein
MTTNNINNNPTPAPDDDGEPFEKAEFGMGKQKPSPEERAREEDVADGKTQPEEVAGSERIAREEDTASEESEQGSPREQAWAEFGLRPPDHSDWHREESAPPVNHELIRRYYDAELSGDELRYVARMLDFETWERALGDLAFQRPPRRPSR